MPHPSPPSRRVRVAGGLSLDAILHADGSAETGRLGGNALWAAVGVRASGSTPYLHARVGDGYPERALVEIAELGIDMSAVRRVTGTRGVRVSYAYAADGTRTQPAPPGALATLAVDERERFVDTTQQPHEILAALPTPDELGAVDAADVWHLGLLPVPRFLELVAHLDEAGAGYLQVDAPARSELRRDGLAGLGDALGLVDVFLPSTSDTDVFAPDRTRSELIALFHRMGAPTVVLKCATDGALVSEGGDIWHVPIHPEPHDSDATGAGDVFAGAFAVSMARTGDPVDAACAGAALASIATRHRDPRLVAVASADEIDRRRASISQGVTRI